MRDRFSRRNRLITDSSAIPGPLADRYTILGQGEREQYTDFAINVDVNDPNLPEVFQPPPPSDQPGPDGMPAVPQYRPVPFWINVDTPAAGAEFVYRHDYDWPARLLQCYFRLVSSAVVGNRIPIITLRDQANNRMAATYPNVSQAASITRDWQQCHNWYLGSGTHSYTGTLGLIMSWLPQVTIMPNWVWGSELALNVLDPGDQLSNIKLLMVREPVF